MVEAQVSSDGTRKWLLKTHDGHEFEMVFIPDADRGTLCVSSQVGCTLNCRFCHTGTMALVRNLEPAEIVGQVMLARDALGEWPSQPEGRMLTNIVMMGMGEPLYNFDNVRDALKIVMDGDGLGLSRRRITLSTSGVVPMMARAGEEIGVNLAVSLHAVTKEIRDEIVPLNRKYGIEQLLEACAAYPGANNARRITFEYVMLKDKNDSDEDARELVRLIRHYRLPAKVNLIPFNPWPGARLRMLDRRTDPVVQQHRLRSRHFGAGADPARPRHRRRLRPAEDRRRAQAPGARSGLAMLAPFRRALVRQVRATFNDQAKGEQPIPRSDDALFPPRLGDLASAWRRHFDDGRRHRRAAAADASSAALGGVWDHSDVQSDMLGRLRRTARFIAVTTYGERDGAEAAIAKVRRFTSRLAARLPDGSRYRADDPAFARLGPCRRRDQCSSTDGAAMASRAMSGADQDRYFAESWRDRAACSVPTRCRGRARTAERLIARIPARASRRRAHPRVSRPGARSAGAVAQRSAGAATADARGGRPDAGLRATRCTGFERRRSLPRRCAARRSALPNLALGVCRESLSLS